MGYYFIDTTTVSEFIASMEKIHIPEKIIIPMSVVFRFFPTVKEEYRAIQDAMKMRGITTFRSPIKMLEYRIVPLMISITKISMSLQVLRQLLLLQQMLFRQHDREPEVKYWKTILNDWKHWKKLQMLCRE